MYNVTEREIAFVTNVGTNVHDKATSSGATIQHIAEIILKMNNCRLLWRCISQTFFADAPTYGVCASSSGLNGGSWSEK